MSTFKLRPMMVAICILILSGCASGPSQPDGMLPRPDGRYDNHTYLVDSSRMDLSQVVSSIVILVTRTKFELPDGTQVDREIIGSGVAINDRFILTVEHTVTQNGIEISTPIGIFRPSVVKLEEKTYIRHGRSEYLLTPLVRNHADDVALFEIPEGIRPPSFPYAVGNSDDLRVGNYVYAVGNPMNLGVNVREGIVSALKAPKEISRIEAKGENAFMISNGLSPGDSGTPVIAIRDGRFELVGLSQGTFAGNGRLGWVIRINAIRDLLENAREISKEKRMKVSFPELVKTSSKNFRFDLSRFWGTTRNIP